MPEQVLDQAMDDWWRLKDQEVFPLRRYQALEEPFPASIGRWRSARFGAIEAQVRRLQRVAQGAVTARLRARVASPVEEESPTSPVEEMEEEAVARQEEEEEEEERPPDSEEGEDMEIEEDGEDREIEEDDEDRSAWNPAPLGRSRVTHAWRLAQGRRPASTAARGRRSLGVGRQGVSRKRRRERGRRGRGGAVVCRAPGPGLQASPVFTPAPAVLRAKARAVQPAPPQQHRLGPVRGGPGCRVASGLLQVC